MTKIRTTILAVVVVFVAIMVFQNGTPRGWYGGDNDDTGRTVTLIALAENDTLTLSEIKVTTSKQGRVLQLENEELFENSWDYDVHLDAGESISIQMLVKVYSLERDDRAFVRCKILDDGDVVRDHRAEVPEARREAYTQCNYTS